MDITGTAVLGAACCFIHLCFTLFYLAICNIIISLGGYLGDPVQKDKTKDLVFSFYYTPGAINLGHFTNKFRTKLDDIKSYHNTFQES
jgi:hypothetical protein